MSAKSAPACLICNSHKYHDVTIGFIYMEKIILMRLYCYSDVSMSPNVPTQALFSQNQSFLLLGQFAEKWLKQNRKINFGDTSDGRIY